MSTIEHEVRQQVETSRQRLDELTRDIDWDPLDGEDPEEMVRSRCRPADAVPMPFGSWNAVCRDEGGGKGVARGWHLTMGAKSGTGKSVMAGNLVHSAIRAGERVGFISLEMSMRQLDTRQLAIISGEPIRKLEQGHTFDPDAMRRAHGAVKKIQRDTGGRVYRSPHILKNVTDVERAIRFLAEGPPRCRFFIVDYLQLAGNPNDPESITLVSHRVRSLARDLRVVTIGLSQLNRETFRRGTRPTMHDLMGGSALENDSDQVLILDHTRLERARAPMEGWESFLVVDKNRHGPTLEIPIRFDSRTLRFWEITPDELPPAEIG
jgi:replicative DNA helicase